MHSGEDAGFHVRLAISDLPPVISCYLEPSRTLLAGFPRICDSSHPQKVPKNVTELRRGAFCPSDRCAVTVRTRFHRSEEHTSELQSLMRISYAVFCLTKKNKNITHAESRKQIIRK